MGTTRRSFITKTLATAGAVALEGRAALAGKRRRSTKRRDTGPQPLFEDHFDRRDRVGWGRNWFNQRYGRRWGINNRRAIYRLPPSENPTYYRPNPILVLDRDVASIDLRATVSVSNVKARLGLVARATGYADYYAAYLGPNDVLRVTRCGHHDERVLGRREMPVEADRRYRIRLQVRGTGPVTVRAKAWPLGGREPQSWMVERIDASASAITDAGAFGIFAQHAVDERGSTLRVAEVVAWSQEEPRLTPPSITYSLAAPPDGSTVTAVAKTAVPARIRFEVAADPTFANALRFDAGRTGRACTARAALDISAFQGSGVVYWRAVAERRGVEVLGPTSSFRPEPRERLPVRFAFGSCTRWKISPRKSFHHAQLKFADFYLHQGDLGYVAHTAIDHAPDTYQDHWVRMLMDPHLSSMVREVPFAFYQDDADYGFNLADAKTLRRFTVRAHRELNANPGSPYFSFRYGDVAVFTIDCRRYSTGKKPPLDKRSKLGAEQKRWLMDGMKKASDDEVGLIVVASPQAFGSDNSPGSWHKHYTNEWSELIDFFESLRAPVLIVSGDSHGHRLHEYPQKNLEPGVPRIVEFVSSGTEQTKWSKTINASIVLKNAKGSGFGLVELGPENTVGEQRTRTLTLSAIKATDGSPYWSVDYLIVRGVGIFPVNR